MSDLCNRLIETETQFNKWIRDILKNRGWMVNRIESGKVTLGYPDLDCYTPYGDNIKLELKTHDHKLAPSQVNWWLSAKIYKAKGWILRFDNETIIVYDPILLNIRDKGSLSKTRKHCVFSREAIPDLVDFLEEYTSS